MEQNNIHAEIIHQVCREVLLPIGVFQKGSSRMYLDDNGYFFTLIEFQPSAWAKGAYLNIGVHFLWHGQECLTFDLGGSRVKDFVEFQNEQQFRSAMIRYAEYAKKRVLFFRKFRNPQLAKWWILCRRGSSPRLSLHKSMICLLADGSRKEAGTPLPQSREELLAIIRQQRAYWRSVPSMKELPHSPEFDR